MTKAELKRKLTPGLELTLVNSYVGPTWQRRKVKQVRSSDVIMLKDDGRESTMTLNPGDVVEETANGFRILQSGKIALQYVWGHPEQPKYDIRLENHGSVFLVRPMNDKAQEWLKNAVQEDAQWLGNALAVEPRYVAGLMEGLSDEGFQVSGWLR